MDSTISLPEAVLAAISILRNKKAASMLSASQLPRAVKRRGGVGVAMLVRHPSKEVSKYLTFDNVS